MERKVNYLLKAEQDVDDQELLSEQEKMIRNLQMKVQNFKIESDIARVQYVFFYSMTDFELQ